MSTVAIREKDVAVMVGIEAVEGTLAPITATNVLHATEASFNPREDLVDRDFRDPSRPLDVQQQATRQWWEMGFVFPYSYSGAAGTPSALEPVFLMCGASQTVNAGTDVVYTREVADMIDSASIQIRTPLSDQSEDYLRQSLASRGTLGFRIAVGEDIVFNVNTIGQYEDPSSVSVITPDYGDQKTNLYGAPKAENVTLKTLDGLDVCLYSIESDNYFGYSVEYHENMCTSGSAPIDLDQGGEIVRIRMAMPDWVNHFNPYVLANRATLNTVPFVFEVGTVAGRILKLDIAEVQVGEPTEVILDNKQRGMELALKIVHDPKIIEA